MSGKYRTRKFHMYYTKAGAVVNKKTVFIFIICLLFVVFSELLITNNEIKKIFTHLMQLNNEVQNEDDLRFHEKLLKITKCYDRALEPAVEQHGAFWVLSNYIPADKQFRCSESVTYATQGDYTFLGNLIEVVNRWKGPVSVALHAPGTDFEPTIDSIAYLRNCEGPLFKKYVTFHLLFDMGHAPTRSSKELFNFPLVELYKDEYDCSKGAPYTNVTYKNLYKMEANISYPINVARSIAREKAQTHFVLASDIELYPSLNLISQFLQMLLNKPNMLDKKDPVIFGLPVFEVLANESIPENKMQLQEMIRNKTSFSFPTDICYDCHTIPKLEEWLSLEASDELDVFITTKKQEGQVQWEAVYIGTNEDPLFDQDLDWERHGNKRSQAYAMCLLNYDYVILDNAFLAYKPSIKRKMVTAKNASDYFGAQVNVLYGQRKGCIA